MRGFQELGGRRNGDLMLIGAEFLFGLMKKF
jgi:hypothetical protein